MDKMIFMRDWYESIMNDEYIETTEQEMSYILYAAMQYCFTGEKINLGEVFGNEFRGLNRSMPNIYSQIDKIMSYNEKQGKKNQKYDNDAIEALAAQGYSQKEICRELGYDESKSRSLSSNAGYKRGREKFLIEKDSSGQKNIVVDSSGKNDKNCDSFNKKCDSSNKTVRSFIDF